MLDKFLNNSKDYPLLAGFLAGYFPFIFYFSRNFDLVNSLGQLFIFTLFYIISSIAFTSFVYFIVKKSKFSIYKSKSIQFSMLLSFSAFLIIIISNDFSWKKVIFFTLGIIGAFTFKITHKYLIIFILLMSIYPTFQVLSIVYRNVFVENNWSKQPDDITKTIFKSKPNIYFIQPDGYANANNLKSTLYNFDNTQFDVFLKSNSFTLYDDFKSNYNSTLKSNASCFNMKHHFYDDSNNFKYSRDHIVGKNAVLETFKNNDYKTFFISERAYLLMNKPNIFYDYSNFSNKQIPFFKDGWSLYMDITSEIKKQILSNKKTSNFFFIEKFSPGHISSNNDTSKGIKQERINYLKGIKEANIWLKDIISFIQVNDEEAMIIIAADHGGFVGFKSTEDSFVEIKDNNLIRSIFGAKLAIKWNNEEHTDYDKNLHSSVNLFRVLFAELSRDKTLLKNLQSDKSYNELSTEKKGKKYYEVKY